MASLSSIGVSSLTAYKLALETVGNNIANVNNEVFGRQTVDFATQQSQQLGKGLA